MKKFPIQPIKRDEHNVDRFVENGIVRFLLDAGPYDLNQLAIMKFNDEEREQFAQLIGYSVSGFGDLSYVSDETFETAWKMAETKQSEAESRIEYLQTTLDEIRESVRNTAVALFKIHPDDLEV